MKEHVYFPASLISYDTFELIIVIHMVWKMKKYFLLKIQKEF